MLLVILLVLISAVAIGWAYKKTSATCRCSRHLVGKVAIVPGGNAGIGSETAKDLAERGARVILACRSEGRGVAARDRIAAASGNTHVHCRHLELASLTSVGEFAENANSTESRLDVLVNNAGVFGSDPVRTEGGLLLGMQSNRFGPFLLTSLLLPKLKTSAPSRIVNVSSLAHAQGTVDLNNLNAEKETEKTLSRSRVYSASKLCNVLTVELARRLEGTGVTAHSLHPGLVETDMVNSIPISKRALPLLNIFSNTPWEGAQTAIYLSVAPEVSSVSGRYFKECREGKASKQA